MPIFMAEDLPDLPDYSAINRAVPQMPSGMTKEEESVSYQELFFPNTFLDHSMFSVWQPFWIAFLDFIFVNNRQMALFLNIYFFFLIHFFASYFEFFSLLLTKIMSTAKLSLSYFIGVGFFLYYCAGRVKAVIFEIGAKFFGRFQHH